MTEQQDSPKKPDFWLFSSESSFVIFTIAALLMVFIVGIAIGSQFSWVAIEPYLRWYFSFITIVFGVYVIALHFYHSSKRGI